jgi:hypothetical protein
MSVLTIKRELPAIRCEICHQADCFTPETAFCTRCAGIVVPSTYAMPVTMNAAAAAAGFLADYRERVAFEGGWWDVLFITPHVFFGLGLAYDFLYASNATAVLTPLSLFVSALCFCFGIYLYQQAGQPEGNPVRAFKWTFVGGGFFVVFLLVLIGWVVWAVVDSVLSLFAPESHCIS